MYNGWVYRVEDRLNMNRSRVFVYNREEEWRRRLIPIQMNFNYATHLKPRFNSTTTTTVHLPLLAAHRNRATHRRISWDHGLAINPHLSGCSPDTNSLMGRKSCSPRIGQYKTYPFGRDQLLGIQRIFKRLPRPHRFETAGITETGPAR
jgi:hypothetical protein